MLFIQEANTSENDPNTPHKLVIDMPEHHPGIMGGTMRLGKRTTVFKEVCDSTISKLYLIFNHNRKSLNRKFSIFFQQKNSTDPQNK